MLSSLLKIVLTRLDTCALGETAKIEVTNNITDHTSKYELSWDEVCKLRKLLKAIVDLTKAQ